MLWTTRFSTSAPTFSETLIASATSARYRPDRAAASYGRSGHCVHHGTRAGQDSPDDSYSTLHVQLLSILRFSGRDAIADAVYFEASSRVEVSRSRRADAHGSHLNFQRPSFRNYLPWTARGDHACSLAGKRYTKPRALCDVVSDRRFRCACR
jgi:hypothetical protein